NADEQSKRWSLNPWNPEFYHLFSDAWERAKGRWLDTKATEVNIRKQLNGAIEEELDLVKSIKDEIDALLNKLGTCSAKTTPTPTPSPTPNKPNNQVGYHVSTTNANGLVVTTFDTPQGKIKVNLTDDIAAGDTISGTVEVEPKGNNDAERGQNQSELNGQVIDL